MENLSFSSKSFWQNLEPEWPQGRCAVYTAILDLMIHSIHLELEVVCDRFQVDNESYSDGLG